MLKNYYWKIMLLLADLKFWNSMRKSVLSSIYWFEHWHDNSTQSPITKDLALENARDVFDYIFGDGGMNYYFPKLTDIFVNKHLKQLKKVEAFLESHLETAK